MGSLFSVFRKIAFLEGVSYVLLLINMLVVKNIDAEMGQSLVYPIGMAHGVLFVAYLIFAFLVMNRYGLGLKWLIIAFVMSVVPLGTFIMEKKWKKEEEDYLKAQV